MITEQEEEEVRTSSWDPAIGAKASTPDVKGELA